MKSAQKLFGTFQHLHDSNEFKGTSIGLTTAQQIIHRHEDSVWAEEEVEKGLHFILPLKINTIKLYTYFFPLEKEIVTYYD